MKQRIENIAQTDTLKNGKSGECDDLMLKRSTDSLLDRRLKIILSLEAQHEQEGDLEIIALISGGTF
jgi:hypothetical protein